MKIVDNRNNDYKNLFADVKVYPFLNQYDTVQFDGFIVVQAYKEFDTVPTGEWRVRMNINIDCCKFFNTQWADDFMAAMKYARQCADIDLLTDASKPLENRPTTITVAEWPTVAEGAVAGQCQVYDINRRVFHIGSRNERDGLAYLIHYSLLSKSEDWRYAIATDKLTVRWLTPAAVDVYGLQVEADARGWYDGKAEAQTEIDDLKRQLAAAQAVITAALDCLRTSLPPSGFGYENQQQFQDEMRSKAARLLDAALQTTPLPAHADTIEVNEERKGCNHDDRE